jgi:Uma2 family endonuclease
MTTPYIARRKPGRPPEPDDGVYYPEAREVLPVVGMFHFVPQAYMQAALEAWLADPTKLVAAEMFIYYEPGNPRAFVAPDVYVIPNVGDEQRRSYFIWLEHEVPQFAMEVVSQSSVRNDLARKWDLYQSWGVQEYWQYDPEGLFMRPLLRGNRLVDGRYVPIDVAVDPESGQCQGFSPLLGLEFLGRREWFRFRDPATGQLLGNRQEIERERLVAEQARLVAEQALQVSEQGRLAAEQALDQERAVRLALQRLLREHGIEPPDSAT